MVFWNSSKKSQIIRRSGVNYKPLTSEEAWQILDSPYRSGYTYAQSASYNSSYPTEYTNPTFGHITEFNYQSYFDDSQSISSSVYLGLKQTIMNILRFFLSIISWIWYFVSFPILYFTPLAPAYITYQKGKDVFSWIFIFTSFLKKVAYISWQCTKDLVLTTGYVSNSLRIDVISAFWSLFGYQYNVDSRRATSQPLERTQDVNENSIWKRTNEAVKYLGSFGYFNSHLAQSGVVPPTRPAHRTRQTKKSRVFSAILYLVGIAYYIVSGQFLFENLETTETQGVMTRRQRLELEQKRKKWSWSWLWWLMALLLLIAVLYYGFARHSAEEPKKRLVNGATADETHHSVAERLHETAEILYEGTGKVVTGTSEKLGSGFRWIYSKIVAITFNVLSHFSNILTSINNAIFSIFGKSRDESYGIFGGIRDNVYYAWEGVYNVLASAGTFVLTVVFTIFEAAKSGLYLTVNFVGSLLWKPITFTSDTVGDIGKKLYNVGSDFSLNVISLPKLIGNKIGFGLNLLFQGIGDVLYYVISNVIFGLLFIWHSFLYVIQWIFSLPLLLWNKIPSLPKSTSYENYHQGIPINIPSDDELNSRIRQLIHIALSESKKEWKNEFVGIIEGELKKVKSDESKAIENIAEMEMFKQKIEEMLQERFSKLGTTIRMEILNDLTKKDDSEKLQKVHELHTEVDHLKVQLATQTGLGQKLRTELSDAINKLTTSQQERYKEYEERLINLKTISPNEEFEKKYSQWESELNELKKEMRSVGAVAQEAQDLAGAVETDNRMRRLEAIINKMFEKERESIRLEKEHINQMIKEKEDGTTKPQMTANEVNQLIQTAINKLNISLIAQEVSNIHSKTHVQEFNYEQFVDIKLRNMIVEIVKNMSYEKTGEPDYALESSGGFVVSTRCTEDHNEFSRRESIFGVPLWFTSYSPRSVIQRQSQNINAGECWAIKGGQAYLVIQLAKRVNVTAVSYEHLPKHLSLTGTIDSAPKDFKIWSLETENDPNKFLVGEYRYDDNNEPLQRFEAQNKDPRGSKMIELEVNTNYGASFTCLYRFRVHGTPWEKM